MVRSCALGMRTSSPHSGAVPSWALRAHFFFFIAGVDFFFLVEGFVAGGFRFEELVFWCFRLWRTLVR